MALCHSNPGNASNPWFNVSRSFALPTVKLSDTDFTAMRGLPKLAPVTPLHANKLFSRVPKAELAKLAEVAREVSVPAGEFVFKEGDPVRAHVESEFGVAQT